MEERHEERHGLFIPPAIRGLVDDGLISVKAAYLLSVIDSLVRCRDEGCWASNEYLANCIQVKVRGLQLILTKLIKLGFLATRINADGQRILETKWAVALHEAVDRGRNKLRRRKKLHGGSVENCAEGHVENCTHRLLGMNVLDEGSSDRSSSAAPFAPNVAATPTPFEHLNGSNVRTNPRPQSLDYNNTNRSDTPHSNTCTVPEILNYKSKTKARHSNNSSIPDFDISNWKYQLVSRIVKQISFKPLRKDEYGPACELLHDCLLWIAERDRLGYDASRDYLIRVIETHLKHFQDPYWPRRTTVKTITEDFARIEAAVKDMENAPLSAQRRRELYDC